MDIQKIQLMLERKKGERDKVISDIQKYQSEIGKLEDKVEKINVAKHIIQTVAKQTQAKLEYHINRIPNICLAETFPEFQLQTKFNIKRDNSECNLSLVDSKGNMFNPLDDCGFGTVDITNLGLRPSILSLIKPVPEKVLILDEPLKHLKGLEANRKAIQLMKTISDKMGIQIITIPDEKVPIHEVEKGADKIIKVDMRDGVSYIKEG